jgi:hypothetical protein
MTISPKAREWSLQPTGMTAGQKRSRPNTNANDRMSDHLVAALRHASPMYTLIPAFLRRQRNQRCLTLEMLSAKVGP